MEPVVLSVESGSTVRVLVLELPGPPDVKALTVTFERGSQLRRIRFLAPYPVEDVFALINEPGEIVVKDISSRQMEESRFAVEFLGPEGERHEFLALAVEDMV
jgi:hypothetical protein